MSAHDLIVRNAYVCDRDAVVDIAVDGAAITSVAESIEERGETELDAESNLVAPGFVECHLHIDKAFGACGGRVPHGHDEPFSFERIAEHERQYFAEATVEDITRNAIKNIEMAVAAGSTYIRSHVSIDAEQLGLQNVEACQAAREQTRHLADLQLVPAGGDPTDDAEYSLLEDAVAALQADARPEEAVLVGGADPATRHTDIERTLRGWFEVAADRDVDIDLHIQDGGNLGVYELDRLAAHTDDFAYDGRVTASHSYGLAHVPEWRLEESLADYLDVDLKFVTCYQSTRPDMPVRTLLDRGITLGLGTDNDRDFVFPHGNADVLEGALIESNKLHGDRTFAEDYRWYDTNDGLEALWSMMTTEGAKVLGIEDEYGIEEGTGANLVVLDEPSPQWAIIGQAERSYVIKDGEIVVEDGDLVPEHTVVEGYRDVRDRPLR